jgi:membrane protein implicated in regulation of membrane protease activity
MIVYISIAAFGFLMLLVMLFVGELFGGDHDLGHEIAAGHLDSDHGGPSIFSVRIMGAFLTAFGVGGVVGRYYQLSHPASSGIGIVTGVLMATVVFQFAKVLYSQQASSEIRMGGLIGQTAEVSVAIPTDGVGQVSVSSAGARSEHIARSQDGRPLKRGTVVVIKSLGGDSVIVAAEHVGSGESV